MKCGINPQEHTNKNNYKAPTALLLHLILFPEEQQRTNDDHGNKERGKQFIATWRNWRMASG